MGTRRFDYALNLARTGSYDAHCDAAWPPDEQVESIVLDLGGAAPPLTDAAVRHLADLRRTIEGEWQRAVELGPSVDLDDRPALAAALRGIGAELIGDDDRRAAALRAAALETGYDDEILAALATLDEEVAVVAGRLATWFGKVNGGRPSAFACRRDRARQTVVDLARRHDDAVAERLRDLHMDLRMGPVPGFVPADVFFMAGEGDLHPKHIAYFLPDDEGVRGATAKRTYYFANTHRRLLDVASAPLAAGHLDVGPPLSPGDARFEVVPTLGVLAHEMGHGVHRPATRYRPINTADRWASVVLQEVAADVFGMVIVADVWAEPLGVAPDDVIAYYLAECVRYVSRGLGHFPDSDGMFLQLAYLVHVGALTIDPTAGPRLVGEPEIVLAGLRSLARVLADATLTGDPAGALALHRAFGPGRQDSLVALLEALAHRPVRSVSYVQSHIPAPVGAAPANRGEP